MSVTWSDLLLFYLRELRSWKMGTIKNMCIIENSQCLYVQFYWKVFICLKIQMNIQLVSVIDKRSLWISSSQQRNLCLYIFVSMCKVRMSVSLCVYDSCSQWVAPIAKEFLRDFVHSFLTVVGKGDSDSSPAAGNQGLVYSREDIV